MVSDIVYSELRKMKKDLSFSKMIEELIQGRGKKGDINQLEKFFGTISDSDAAIWKKEVTDGRRASGKSRLVK